MIHYMELREHNTGLHYNGILGVVTNSSPVSTLPTK